MNLNSISKFTLSFFAVVN